MTYDIADPKFDPEQALRQFRQWTRAKMGEENWPILPLSALSLWTHNLHNGWSKNDYLKVWMAAKLIRVENDEPWPWTTYIALI